MKKFLSIIAAVAFFGTSLFAQNKEFNYNVLSKGTNMASLGIGFNTREELSVALPPISATYEYGLFDFNKAGAIGLGAYLGTALYKDVAKDHHAKFVIAARAAYHYTVRSDFEVYGGLMCGYSYFASVENYSSFAKHFFVGARYMFWPNAGLHIEAGHGVTFLNLGVSFKF